MAQAKTKKGKQDEEEEVDEVEDDEEVEDDDADSEEEADDSSDEDEEDDSDEDDDDEGTAAIISENNRLKREAAERSKKDREARRKQAKKDGKFERLAQEETERADKAEAELARFQRRANVTKVADRLNMEDPEDAFRFLDEDDMDDERLAERALKKLRDKRPSLFKTKRRSGKDIDSETDDDDPTRDKNSGGEGVTGFERLRSVKRKT